ncbi:MAG: hypothetical protein HOM14_19715 [Gammaproteobacteria bacterium]|jgi:type IV pilus assembly protein PilW|nr:hypothetical protein [Gammaproteobacteria bacterium]MBT3722313.1 hypothetical protein [Gammaproteobacteria bacterium]MBT4196641.1 hypothetical protein [Gammaproteobacteria bacterium]MBT4448393.1 hypothetical protein [Gammaproteobacteria bacterium]MBT4863016.1 hypothetical protein [Gammaproteobacteria bacterium]
MKIFLSKQTGLSLVEIMVALVISLFLMGGITQVYLGNNASYRFSDASSRIQENGRFVLDTITTDVRMSGFWGCISFQEDDGDGQLADDNPSIQNHLNRDSDNFDTDLHDFINNPSMTATVNDGLNGSDSLTLRGTKPGSYSFTGNLTSPGDGTISVVANNNLSDNDIILITNCFTADIFEATTVSADGTTITHTSAAATNTPGNSNPNDCAGTGSHCLLDKNDQPFTPNNAAAFSLQSVTYSVQLSGSGSGEPALWRSVNNINQELIEGIEQMQILFGEDTSGDGSPNQYRTSDQVADPNQVTAIRIWLVVRSERENVLDESQIYIIDGVNESQDDNRLRQVFSTTIALRNRTG